MDTCAITTSLPTVPYTGVIELQVLISGFSIEFKVDKGKSRETRPYNISEVCANYNFFLFSLFVNFNQHENISCQNLTYRNEKDKVG